MNEPNAAKDNWYQKQWPAICVIVEKSLRTVDIFYRRDVRFFVLPVKVELKLKTNYFLVIM